MYWLLIIIGLGALIFLIVSIIVQINGNFPLMPATACAACIVALTSLAAWSAYMGGKPTTPTNALTDLHRGIVYRVIVTTDHYIMITDNLSPKEFNPEEVWVVRQRRYPACSLDTNQYCAIFNGRLNAVSYPQK